MRWNGSQCCGNLPPQTAGGSGSARHVRSRWILSNHWISMQNPCTLHRRLPAEVLLKRCVARHVTSALTDSIPALKHVF